MGAGSTAAAAAVLALLDRRSGAIVLVIASLAQVALGLAAPQVAARLDRSLVRFGAGAAKVISTLIAALAWLFGVLPLWLWTRIWRRSPTDNPWISARSAWTIPPSSSNRDSSGAPQDPVRSGGTDALPIPSSTARRVARAGLAVLLMLGGMAVVAHRRGLAVPLPFLDHGRTTVMANASSDDPQPPDDVGGDTAPDGETKPKGQEGNGGSNGANTSDDVVFPTVAPRQADAREVQEFDGLPVDGYAHDDEPWAPRHFGELTQLPYAPDFFLGARIFDMTGKTVNVVDGRRVSYTPEDPEITVWFFGGSTMFGIGQRDNHTLPSVIARAAEADGIRIRAVNFGVSGYVNWQATERFEQALTSDLEKPDLVVFYDGVNDWGLGAFRVDLGDRKPGVIRRLPLGDDEREQMMSERSDPEPMPWSTKRENLEIDLTADQYGRGVDIAQRLGKEYDIPVRHVWQPSPFAKVLNPVDEPLWERVDFNPDWMEASARHYRQIAERSGADPIDLTRVLDEVKVPVYFDSSHTNEFGASLIGNALYRELKADLEEASMRR